jgi:hypothetical protein
MFSTVVVFDIYTNAVCSDAKYDAEHKLFI